jgi:hypothetical protein
MAASSVSTRRKERPVQSRGVVCLLGFVLIGLMAVGGCGDDGSVRISIQVDVSPESATVGIGGTLQIIATVVGGGSADIAWYVNDVVGGNATIGTVIQTNPTTYAAPATLPDTVTVVVKAEYAKDPTKFDTCTITLTRDVVVNVTPPSATVGTSGAFTISANVTGGTTNEVEWYVNDVLSGNVIVGTVTQANPTLYTAPHTVPSPATVVVKAVSTEDGTKYGTCTVTVIEPPVISVQVTPERRSIEVSEAFSVSAGVTGGTTNQVQWYVNNSLGGNSVLGTITQTNPATYTAPDEVPVPDSVRVIAVSQEDVSKRDTCVVKIGISTFYVDASVGDDVTGTGTVGNPVKSIKRGLQLAEAGQTVNVAPGLYDAANGEVFPIYLRGESLVGENWEACILRGHDNYGSCVSLGGTGSVLRKFTIEEGPVEDEGWDIAINVESGAESALLDSILCFERARYSVVRVDNAVNCTVQNSVFDVRAISEVDRGFNRGFEIVFDDQGTVLRNCTVRGFHNGGHGNAIFFNGSSDALVENCRVEDNGWGFYLCCYATPTSNPAPDLGGGARGSTGGNIIRNNDSCGLVSYSTNDVYARFNTWTNDPPVEGEDYCIGETGDIIVE